MTSRSLIIAVCILLAASLGLGAYAWRMRSHAVSQVAANDAQPVAPPASGPTEQATLYVAYDSPGVILPEAANLPLPEDRQQRARGLLRALIQRYTGPSSPHALAATSDIRDVYLVDPGLAVVDLNADLANGHRSGVLVEELTVASFIQTLSANVPGISRVKFLVDGKERETLAGHADLMDVYDVNLAGEMVDALQASQ